MRRTTVSLAAPCRIRWAWGQMRRQAGIGRAPEPRPRLVPRGHRDSETTATAASLRALARRIQLLDRETADHTRAITTLVQGWRADLLRRAGGTDRGHHRAVCLVSCGPLPLRHHPRDAGRGPPIPASGAQTVRYRLNRSGARDLNRGPAPGGPDQTTNRPGHSRLHPTATRRGQEQREIRRCLVRFITCQLYRLLEADPRFDPT
jgi:transposase